MENAQESAVSGLIDSLSSLGDDDSPEQIKHYEVLVAEELGRIDNKYLNLWDRILNSPDPLVLFNQVDIRMDLSDQLQSKRLPALKRQVISLSNALLGRADLQAKPVSKLKIVLKVLSKLDLTLGKIKFAVACINPGLDPVDVRHDREFKNVKQLICCRLALTTYVVTGLVCELLRTYRRFIEESGHVFDGIPEKRTESLTMRDTCSDAIDKALNLINKSELNFIQDAWKSDIDSIDDSLEKFLLFLHLQPPLSEEESRLVGREVGDQSLSTTTICVMAIIKLSRLLLAKLVKLSKDKENISMLSDLSSREFEIFAKMTTTLSESIEKLVCALCGDFIDDHVQDVLIIQKSLSQILSAPKIILDMVEYIFVPVVQPADQPSSKLYYKTQFYYWNQVHQSITRRFTQALGFTTS
ncbi:hypothetical protein PGT21_033939 [Puccinia graminis f. sp. tritici]|uniref:Uncharacterized protein n=1 Tax=Puccinia graminis f. sp. tritici TaxID=56615 RepID=A0A5B0PEW2_PUCGR|nr:hypothetical protein PGT21_033939 [Puccinia graminis f. sp. tritici]KAA1125618.1 hypothetical protein PGTUg99_011974 [Puccinia graminis f. sp. tritici]